MKGEKMTVKQKNLRPIEAAEYLGVSTSTLAKWRCYKQGPAFVRIGKKLIAYPIEMLDEFAGRRFTDFNDEGTA